MLVVFLHGLLVLAGAVIIAWDLLTLRPPSGAEAGGAAAPA
jgi:hypothetical protein